MRPLFLRSLPALALGAAALSVSCGDDLGSCDVDAARTPVLVGGQVMYAGQAIMLQTCASGCHSSGAKGSARIGAPAGLDFDLRPLVSTGGVEVDNLGQVVRAQGLDAVELRRLKARQGEVFDQRDNIWKQIQKDLMPPDGVGEEFRVREIADYFTRDASGECTRGTKLVAIEQSETRDVLRNWLACGVPIVEAESSELPAFDLNGSPARYGGVYGDQYPSCGTPSDAPPFDAMYDNFIGPACVVCHKAGGVYPAFDLGSPELAYAAMMGAAGQGGVTHTCATNPNPMVTAGDPAASYLVAKLGGSQAGVLCGFPMPQGVATGATAQQLKLVTDWISAGAPAPGVSAGN